LFGTRKPYPDTTSLRDRLRGALQGPNLSISIIGVFAALAIALSFTIWLPSETSIRRTIKVIHSGQGGIYRPHGHGCGNYWHTETIGRGMEASVQLAAGFCWDGTNVRWVWGLHRNDCRPIANVYTRVKMTCQITGGHKAPLEVRYVAVVSPALMPIMSRTITIHLIVSPQGYILAIPGETV
jgi:hypothetical protein